MEDWTEIIGKALREEEKVLPSGEWETIRDAMRRSSRRRAAIWTCGVGAAVVAAVVVLSVLLPGNPPAPSPNPNIVTVTEKVTDDTTSTSTPEAETDLVAQTLPDEQTNNDRHPIESDETATAKTTSSQSESAGQESSENESAKDETTSAQANVGEEKTEEKAAKDDEESVKEPEDNMSESAFYQEYAEQRRDKRKMSVSIWESNLLTQADKTDTKAGSPNQTQKVKYDHEQPISFGINFRYGIDSHFSIASGVDYTLCNSTVSYNDSRKYDQKVGYISVPVRIDWAPVKTKHFQIYLGAGGRIRKSIHATFDGEKLTDKRFYPSLIAACGIQYNFIRSIGIFLEPEYSYTFLPESPSIITYYTESSKALSFRLGLSFSFR
jgi:hypothetical protein